MFQDFLKNWGVTHRPSSPYYPQSNGHAEASVKSIKNLILKTTSNGNIDCDEFLTGLLELRNTPRQDGLSPAEVLYGHPIRSKIPIHSSAFHSRWKRMNAEWDKRRSEQLKKSNRWYNQTAKPMDPIRSGTVVRVQDPIDHTWETMATVIKVGRYRDYLLKSPSGKTFWRNRKFITAVTTNTSF